MENIENQESVFASMLDDDISESSDDEFDEIAYQAEKLKNNLIGQKLISQQLMETQIGKYHCWYCELYGMHSVEALNRLNELKGTDYTVEMVNEDYANCKNSNELTLNGVKVNQLALVYEFLSTFSDYESPHITKSVSSFVDWNDLVVFTNSKIPIFKNRKLVKFTGIIGERAIFSCYDHDSMRLGLEPEVGAVYNYTEGEEFRTLRCSDGNCFLLSIDKGQIQFYKVENACDNYYIRRGNSFYGITPHDIKFNGSYYAVTSFTSRYNIQSNCNGKIIDTGLGEFVGNKNYIICCDVYNGILYDRDERKHGNVACDDGTYSFKIINGAIDYKSKVECPGRILDTTVSISNKESQCQHVRDFTLLKRVNITLDKPARISKNNLLNLIHNLAKNNMLDYRDLGIQLKMSNYNGDFDCLRNLLLCMGFSFVNGQYCYSLIHPLNYYCGRVLWRTNMCTCPLMFKRFGRDVIKKKKRGKVKHYTVGEIACMYHSGGSDDDAKGA